MINLLSLDRGEKPIVQSFATGSVAPKAAGELPLADSMAAANIDAAVLVVNPADNTTYYYMEGMNAPASNYQSYGAAARAVTVVDRSLKETEPGVYTSKVRIPVAGRYDVALMVNSPRIIDASRWRRRRTRRSPRTRGAHRGRVPRQEPRGAARSEGAGARAALERGRQAASRAEGRDHAFVPGAGPAARGDDRARGRARRVRGDRGDPEHGAYSIHVASKTLKKEYRDLAFLSLRTARPDIEAEIKRRMAEAKR